MMMRSFYPTEILIRLGVNESELWERYNVEEGDWLALSAIFLGEIFSSSILQPLGEEETRIQLEVCFSRLLMVSFEAEFKLLISSSNQFRPKTSIWVVMELYSASLILTVNPLNGLNDHFSQKLFPCLIFPFSARSIAMLLTAVRLGRKNGHK